jgi:hypothetical protein
LAGFEPMKLGTRASTVSFWALQMRDKIKLGIAFKYYNES